MQDCVCTLMCIIHFHTHIFLIVHFPEFSRTSSSKTRTRTDRCSAPRKRFICHQRENLQFSFSFHSLTRHSLTLKQEKKKPRACKHSQSRRLHPATLANCSLSSRLKVACRARRHARYVHRSTWQPQHLISLLGHCDKRLDAGAVAGNPSGGGGD